MLDTRGESHTKVLEARVPSKQHLEILKWPTSDVGFTRQDLHEVTGISITSLCARLKELCDMGMIETASTRWNPETKRNVKVYYRT